MPKSDYSDYDNEGREIISEKKKKATAKRVDALLKKHDDARDPSDFIPTYETPPVGTQPNTDIQEKKWKRERRETQRQKGRSDVSDRMKDKARRTASSKSKSKAKMA